eukprot:CAMPEP_0180440472 /NCGR_PEP_ID=MMETSP1036_2-20121128/13125_1 /TAXON_ID=632150 /ORGANISM="Azadinium spinosum, Strain 3D9" /LENGTH=118 /DNA_ID=CAMNT_0022446651 /DNA_START=638 /DNA_END=995 /DNA_ORIENTATION=-
MRRPPSALLIASFRGALPISPRGEDTVVPHRRGITGVWPGVRMIWITKSPQPKTSPSSSAVTPLKWHWPLINSSSPFPAQTVPPAASTSFAPASGGICLPWVIMGGMSPPQWSKWKWV